MEAKKRPLRRSSKGGDAVALLIDLSEALFRAQVQAARHELVLYREGKLELEDDGRKHVIVRGAREVERIALTQLDYGSLQDRQVLSNVFLTIAGSSITSNDPSVQKTLGDLEKRGRELVALNAELERFRSMGPNPFYNCWFLSIGHLLVMLDHVSSNEDLWTQLRLTRSTSFSSLDFYFEYAGMRKIRFPSVSIP